MQTPEMPVQVMQTAGQFRPPRASPGVGPLQGLLDQLPAGAGPVCALAQYLPERASARLAMEQPQYVTGHVLQRQALLQLGLDVGPQGTQQVVAWLFRTLSQGRIQAMQYVGVVVGSAAEHDAVGLVQMLHRGLHRRNAAIEHHRQRGALLLEAIRPVVTQRRHFAVFLGRQALEPRVAGMHHHHGGTGCDHLIDEAGEHGIVVIVVHAEAAFDRDRQRGRRTHGGNTVGHQRRLAHQAGTEAPGLHAIGRAAAIEVDLVVAPLLRDRRRLRKQCRLATAQLQRQRCSTGSNPISRVRSPWITALACTISVYRRAEGASRRWKTRQWRSVQSIIGATDRRREAA